MQKILIFIVPVVQTYVRFLVKKQLVKAGYEASGYESIELFPKKNKIHLINASKKIDQWLRLTKKKGFKSCVVVIPYEMQISQDAKDYYQSINIKFESDFENFSTQKYIKENLKDNKNFFFINKNGFKEKKVGSYFVFNKGDKIDFNHPNRLGHLVIAKEEIKNFKKDLESLEVKLEKFFSEAKINESEYRIISWAEINYVDLVLMEQKNKEIDLYNEKVVARGKVGGCYAFDKEKYFFCTDSEKYEGSETRNTIIIDNIDSLTSLKEIYGDFAKLGLKKGGLLLPYPKDIYDLQLYGKIKKIGPLTNRMEVHSIKFIKRLVTEKTILRLLEGKIFNSDWKKVKEFQASRSL